MNSDPCRFRKISKLKPRPKKNSPGGGGGAFLGGSFYPMTGSYRFLSKKSENPMGITWEDFK